MPRLHRVDWADPGFARRRAGRGFSYLDEHGLPLRDTEALERVRALGIPPAWREVWICADAAGHLQAVGTDAAGRRQYLYHPHWRVRRDREKFDEMVRFGQALPALRRAVAERLSGEGLTRERVLACAVHLLDLGFFRIGGAEYLDENGSHGLATLDKRHVRLAPGDAVIFDYVGKAGKRRLQRVVDPEVRRIAAELKRRRGGGTAFLAYKNGRWNAVRADEINALVKELSGAAFSAKHFRTWHATVLAAVALAVSGAAEDGRGRQRAITRAVGEVAHYLGNTPAVCRSSYIDPRVIERYLAGDTIAPALGALAEPSEVPGPATQGAVEHAVLGLLAG